MSLHLPHRHPNAVRLIRLALALAFGVSLVIVAVAGIAAPASAVSATGTGVGYLSRAGWWIGSWSLADGTRGFCVNLGAATPTGHDFTPVDAAELGWYSADDRARLAYISRRWSQSADPDTAAAAQLATWSITGLAGHSLADLAARAGARAVAVRELAERMIAETNAADGASHAPAVHVTIERGPDGSDAVRADIDVPFLAGTATIPADRHDGTITLTGAVFDDGSATKRVRNGVAYPIRPTGAGAVVSLGADAGFSELPYGDSVTIAHTDPQVQSLLIAPLARANGHATTRVEHPSPMPFQPRVVTKASSAVAAPGEAVHDTLRVDAVPVDGGSADAGSAPWGVSGPDGGPYTPIPVTVRSRLLGPFDAAPAESDQPPADAPVVCEVTTLIDHGAGEYNTPECTLPGTGHYVWVESIRPEDTPMGDAPRVLPWTSRFGVADEIVMVPAAAAPTPEAPAQPQLAKTGTAGSPAALIATAAVLLGCAALGVRAVRTRFPRRRRALSR